MAREWSLSETKALVEEHIELKEEEKAEARTASEHWIKVAKRLREKGFDRSHKSCNKRWYRLEQYEVQIFSFNMEEGKLHKNFWDLTRAERLEHRGKWPQLPSGDGIDKGIFDALKRFSHQYEKKVEVVVSTSQATDPSTVDHKDVKAKVVEPKVTDLNTGQSGASPPVVVSARPTFAHPLVVGADSLKRQEVDSQKPQVKSTSVWPAASDSVQQPLSSQDALDGFKLQARELRRRRAAELRRNNRTAPYKSTHTTFMKATAPSSQLHAQSLTRLSESTVTPPFGSVTVNPVTPSPDFTSHVQPGVINNPTATVTKENTAGGSTNKPPFHLKRPNPFTDQAPQHNHRFVPAQPQPVTGSYNPVTFQSPNHVNSSSNFSAKPAAANHQQAGVPLLQSVNSHLPLLQPDNDLMSQPAGSSLEEQLQVILGVAPGPLQAAVQHCDQQLHKNQNNMDGPQFRRNMHQTPSSNGNQGSATASLLGTAIGGLGVHLGAIVKLMQDKHAAEQEFRDKMLMFVECMVVSLHTIAQVSARTSGN